ncbi:MAG: NYN domain-containing protein [Thermodesulfovibrionales bacterium]
MAIKKNTVLKDSQISDVEIRDPQPRLAVLIDADNAQPSIIEGLLSEVAKYGVASVKRIYGDWTNTRLSGWKDVLLQYSILPIQQFGYTTGKNSTDNAMIIDAMDLLYTNRFDGFCLVSSDSDFTRLASRIREEGITVYGFGEKKTPQAFVSACDKFIYTEVLRLKDDISHAVTKRTTRELKMDTKLVNLLRSAIDDGSDDIGWANLAVVGRNISNQSPDFDPRNYGYKKLKDLIKATDLFEIEERTTIDGQSRIVYVRDKRKKTSD